MILGTHRQALCLRKSGAGPWIVCFRSIDEVIVLGIRHSVLVTIALSAVLGVGYHLALT
jgi:hypothetical protein